MAAFVLGDDDRRRFIEDGWIVVRGLIPEERMAATRAALFAATGESPDDPSTWQGSRTLWDLDKVGDPCRLPAIDEVGEALVGPGIQRDPSTFGWIPVVNHPRPGPSTFAPTDRGHIDGGADVTLWPRTWYLAVLAYLTDADELGGATAVRPGSHRQVFEHWLATGHGGSTEPPDLPYAPAVPVRGRAGDVVFMHYLLVHSSSWNRSGRIRVALNTAIQPDPAVPYRPKAGPPAADWTPLDWTLRTDTLAARATGARA